MPVRWKMNNSRSPKNLLWRETGPHSLCREYTGPKNSQISRLQAILNHHGKIGPVTGIEVLQGAGTWLIEVQVPPQQPGNSKSWVRKSWRIQQYAQTFIPTETDHQTS